jgi:hypothetical protein
MTQITQMRVEGRRNTRDLNAKDPKDARNKRRKPVA